MKPSREIVEHKTAAKKYGVDHVTVMRQVVATLTLVACRIRELRRALVGSEHPANPHAPRGG